MLKLKEVLLLSALALSAAVSASAQAQHIYGINPIYRPHFINNEEYTFTGDMYTFVSHAVDGWDAKKLTYPGVQSLLSFSKKHIITTFGVVSKYGGEGLQFYTPNEVSFLVESDAGQSKFKFTKAKNFLIGGGNLSLCLCELLRDLVRSTAASSTQPLNLFLVSDAIYDDVTYWPYPQPSQTQPKFTLRSIVNQPNMTDEIVFEYIERRVIGTGANFCPGQNVFRFPQVDKNSVTFKVFHGLNLIGTVGNGQAVTVNLIAVDSSDLEKVIAGFGADRAYPSEFP